MRGILYAVEFFTRVSLPASWLRWRGFDEQGLAASLVHWPLVGALVGGVSCAVGWGVLSVLALSPANVWVAVVLSVLCGVWLTGAMHEDGLADLMDGLGGARTPERSLEIMKDPRLGTYGVLTLVFLLLLKCALLVALSEQHIGLMLWVWWYAHIISRAAGLAMAYTLPYVGDAAVSKSKHILASVTLGMVMQAKLWVLVALAFALWFWPSWLWVWGGLSVGGMFVYMSWVLWRRLGGVTGDALGATQQLCEVSFLFAALLYVRVHGA
jgi:adenosylcobinamide-GDP ribazoletransferase